MKTSFTLLFSVLLFLHTHVCTAASNRWPDPEPCMGNCSYIHDPSVIKRSDGTWFRFSTNGNIAIASAPNITGPWKYLDSMLPKGSVIQITKNQEIWVCFYQSDFEELAPNITHLEVPRRLSRQRHILCILRCLAHQFSIIRHRCCYIQDSQARKLDGSRQP